VPSVVHYIWVAATPRWLNKTRRHRIGLPRGVFTVRNLHYMGIPKRYIYIKLYFQEMCYVPADLESTAGTVLCKRLRSHLRAAIGDTMTIRITLKQPSAEWQDLHTPPFSPDVRSTWRRLLHYLLFTQQRLHFICLPTSAECSFCRTKNTLQLDCQLTRIL
jgi:hypothetical protein